MSAARPHALTAFLVACCTALAGLTVMAPAPAVAADPVVPASASGPLLANGSVGMLDRDAATMSSFTASGTPTDSVPTGIDSYRANGAGVLPDGDLAVGVGTGVKRVNPLTMHVTGALLSDVYVTATSVSPAGDLYTVGIDRQIRRQVAGTGSPTIVGQTKALVNSIAVGPDGTVFVIEKELTYIRGEFRDYQVEVGTVVRFRRDGSRAELFGGIVNPVGLTLSPSGTTLYTMQKRGPLTGIGERGDDGTLSAYDLTSGSARVVTNAANRFVDPQSITAMPNGDVLIAGRTCQNKIEAYPNSSCKAYANGLTRVDPSNGAISTFVTTSPPSSGQYAPGYPTIAFVYSGNRVPSPDAFRPFGVADTLSATVQDEIRLPVMANDRFTGERGFVRIADGGNLPGADAGAAQPSGALRADGDTVVYKPTGEAGTFTFYYYVWNDAYRSGPVRVDLTLVPQVVIPNDYPPVANPDRYVTAAGQRLSLSTGGILANDTDADPDRDVQFFYFPVPDSSSPFINRNGTKAPLHGTLDSGTGGDGLEYTPDSGFTGTDTFVYGAIDNDTSLKPIPDSQLGTVTIDVVGAPRPDDAAPASQSFDVLTATNLTSADVDVVLPTFTSSRGAVTRRCTTPSGSVVTGRTNLFFGTTVITCRATDDLGQTTRFDTTVEVHQVTAQVSTDRSTAKTGERVPYTVVGRTDDGRDVGDVSSQVELSVGGLPTGACEGTRCYRTDPGPLRVVPLTRTGRPAGSVSNEVTVVTGDAARLSVASGAGQTAAVNTSWADPAQVRVVDAYDNPITGAPVTFTVVSGRAGFGDGLASSTTVASQNDGSAAATLRTGADAGQVVVRVSSPGTPSVDVVGRVVDGTLALVSGGGQQVEAGSAPVPVTVSVADSSSRPLAGVPITFQVISGGASFGGADRTTVRTDSAGGAAVTPRLSTTPGPVVIGVSGIGTAVQTTLTVVAGPTVTTAVTPNPANAVAGEPVRFTVIGADRYGNTTGDLTSAATFVSSNAGVTCQQATCTPTKAGPASVRMTYGTLSTVVVPLMVVAGRTASLGLSPSAPSSVAGSPVGFTLTGRDAYDNSTGDLTATSTLVTTSNGAECAAGTCTGTRSGSYTVIAKRGGITSNGVTIAVTPAAADTVTATSGSAQSTVSGSRFADPLVATVIDAYGNAVPGVTVTFTLPAGTSTSGSASFPAGSTATAVTGTDGRASSPTVNAGTTTGPITATATVAGIADPAVYTLAVTQAGSPRADLTLGLSSPAQVAPGATTTLTATVRNAGPAAATKASTALLVPRGWVVVDAGGATRLGKQVLVFQTASVASGGTASYTVKLRAPGLKGYGLLAGLSLSAVQDPKYANNLAAAVIQVK